MRGRKATVLLSFWATRLAVSPGDTLLSLALAGLAGHGQDWPPESSSG